jgi:hypothetical protein
MQTPPPVLLEPQYFVPLFVAVWIAVSGLLSHMGGWRSLAAMYPDQGAADGETFRFASMSLGKGLFPVNYGSCLSVRVGVRGIRLATLIFFRLFHPPFFIPWSAVSTCKDEKFFFLKQTAVYLTAPDTRLRFTGRVGRAIRQHYDTSHGLPNKSLPADTHKDTRR